MYRDFDTVKVESQLNCFYYTFLFDCLALKILNVISTICFVIPH